MIEHKEFAAKFNDMSEEDRRTVREIVICYSSPADIAEAIKQEKLSAEVQETVTCILR